MTLVDRLKRRNLILGVLAALLLAWIVLRPAETSAVRKESLPSLFPKLLLDNVRQIQIQRPVAAGVASRPTQGAGDVVLTLREAGTWVMATSHGYPASTQKVTAFLETLQAAKRKLFVSSRTETFEQYAPEDGWIRVMVQGAGGEMLASFELGKNAAWSEPYLRMEDGGKPAIIRAWNLATDRIGLSLDAWADVAVWPGLAMPAVEGIDVFQREEKGTLSFVREEREIEKPAGEEGGADPTAEPATELVWRMRAPQEAEAVRHKVDNLARAFTGMRAQRVAAREGRGVTEDQFGLDNPSYRVVVKTPAADASKGSDTWVLKVGSRVPAETEDGTRTAWYVRRADDAWIFEVDGLSVADFQEPAQSFLPEPEPEPADEPSDEGAEPSDQATGDPGSGGEPDEEMPPLPPIDEPIDEPKEPDDPK